MSFVARVVRGRSLVYYLALSHEAGKQSYVVIEVERLKHDRFRRLLESAESMDLSGFGTVHYNAWVEPTETNKAYFREKFGLFEN